MHCFPPSPPQELCVQTPYPPQFLFYAPCFCCSCVSLYKWFHMRSNQLPMLTRLPHSPFPIWVINIAEQSQTVFEWEKRCSRSSGSETMTHLLNNDLPVRSASVFVLAGCGNSQLNKGERFVAVIDSTLHRQRKHMLKCVSSMTYNYVEWRWNLVVLEVIVLNLCSLEGKHAVLFSLLPVCWSSVL